MTGQCPNALANHPDARTATEAWRWRKENALGSLYPAGISAWLVEALNFLDTCFGEIDLDNNELRRLKQEAQVNEWRAKHGGGGA